MRQITQPRCAVDPRCREPIAIMKLHLTGAHPDKQPDRQQRGPLQLQRSRHRIGGAGERHLKTVTLAMFDRPHPAMGSDDIGHEFVQAAHRGGHDVWLVLPQPHRALNLRRQQCDGGGSKISGHTQPAPVHQQRIRAWIDAAHASQRAAAEYGKPSAQTPASRPNAPGSTTLSVQIYVLRRMLVTYRAPHSRLACHRMRYSLKQSSTDRHGTSATLGERNSQP